MVSFLLIMVNVSLGFLALQATTGRAAAFTKAERRLKECLMFNVQFSMFNGRNDDLYALRADAAAQQVRTHEDRHLPQGVQPLQMALLRKAQSRPSHPPRTGGPQKPLVKSSFSLTEKLLFT